MFPKGFPFLNKGQTVRTVLQMKDLNPSFLIHSCRSQSLNKITEKRNKILNQTLKQQLHLFLAKHVKMRHFARCFCGIIRRWTKKIWLNLFKGKKRFMDEESVFKFAEPIVLSEGNPRRKRCSVPLVFLKALPSLFIGGRGIRSTALCQHHYFELKLKFFGEKW